MLINQINNTKLPTIFKKSTATKMLTVLTILTILMELQEYSDKISELEAELAATRDKVPNINMLPK